MPTSPKSAVLNVRIEPEELARFQDWCNRTKRTSASEVIRQWVYEALGDVPARPEPSGGASPAHGLYQSPEGKRLNRKQRRALVGLIGGGK